jgi:hypothetical protein
MPNEPARKRGGVMKRTIHTGERRVVHVKKDSYDVYVGRGRDSVWGNPFRIGVDGGREEVIEKYKAWITRGGGRPLLRRLGELEGATLGCWCAPKGGLAAHEDPVVCHGQILLKLLEHRERKLRLKRRATSGENT